MRACDILVGCDNGGVGRTQDTDWGYAAYLDLRSIRKAVAERMSVLGFTQSLLTRTVIAGLREGNPDIVATVTRVSKIRGLRDRSQKNWEAVALPSASASQILASAETHDASPL